MILADKIIKLRKQCGWSQEDLAEKVNVSRQSVSKWESAASIPDLNKIIAMADLFGVTTDYLVKDDIEERDSIGEDKDPGIIKVTLEDASKYVELKREQSRYIAQGVILSIFSVIPLFFLMGLSEGDPPLLSSDMAAAFGVTAILIAVSVGVSLFLRSNRYDSQTKIFEEHSFELAYGVQGVFKDRLEKYQNRYTQRLSLCISAMIVSVVPLLLSGIFSESDRLIFMMLVLMFVIIGSSIYLLIPGVMENNAYNLILGEGDYSPGKREETQRSEKLGAFYWPLVTAVYIGWSLWTMAWGITWIIWPVAGIAFAALVGLMGLLRRDNG